MLGAELSLLGGVSERVKRPRVHPAKDGEVELEVYRSASNRVGLLGEVFGMEVEGMAQRTLKRVKLNDASGARSCGWNSSSLLQHLSIDLIL